MIWLSVFKHLLPSGRAWRVIGEKTLRRFFKGLSGIGDDLQEFLNLIFLDLDPAKTRELPFWNSQFNLISSSLSEEQQRNRLAGAWSTTGGQSPKYIQEQLQSAGFNVFSINFFDIRTSFTFSSTGSSSSSHCSHVRHNIWLQK